MSEHHSSELQRQRLYYVPRGQRMILYHTLIRIAQISSAIGSPSVTAPFAVAPCGKRATISTVTA